MEFLSTYETGNTSMNTYKTKFFVRCPVNNEEISYKFEIKINKKILVEEILDFVNKFDAGFHEDIADELFEKFGGVQKISANHHGVVIHTERK